MSLAVLLLALLGQAEPVSYRRQVEPILAMRCHACHNDPRAGSAAGLSTRSHRALLAGGNLGPAVAPGDPDASLLVHFLEGRRGEERRMPQGGKPLAVETIELIRRWIREGAREDAAEMPQHRLSVTDVATPRGKVVRIRCRIPVEAFLTLEVRAGARLLREETATVKLEKERADAGIPGEWIQWELRSEPHWPRRVGFELTLHHAAREPQGAELHVMTEGRTAMAILPVR